MKRIGLLGCGSIGSQIAIAIDTGKIPAQLTHIFDEDRTKSDLLLSKLQKKPEIVENVPFTIVKSTGSCVLKLHHKELLVIMHSVFYKIEKTC